MVHRDPRPLSPGGSAPATVLMSSEEPITHQISPPEPGLNYLEREHLLHRAEEYLERRLILIQAPAGYGKTALLASLVGRVRQPACWVTVTEHDRDPGRLGAVIRASLLRRFRRLGHHLPPEALSGLSPLGMARAMTEAVRAHVPEAFLLALDDVHLVNESDEALALLDGLLAELPPRVTLAMAGRALPRLNVAPLVVDAQVGGLGAYDLALTREELGALAEGLEPDRLDELYEATQGWIAGARLMLSLPESGSESAALDESAAMELLGGAMVEAQEPELRRFLLESSLLPVITVDACNRVLGRRDSGEMLAKARARGLFLTLIQHEPETYEYHPLFRGALRARLASEDRARWESLVRAAAADYEEEGVVERALELYRDGEMVDEVARLADSSARQLFESGRTATLEYWADWLRSRDANLPNLYLHMAVSSSDRGQLRAAEAWTRAAEAPDDDLLEAALEARLKIQRSRIAFQRSDFANCLELAHQASQILATLVEPRFSGECLRLMGVSRLRLAGDLELAEHEVKEAIRLFEAEGDRYRHGSALQDLATILSARGRLEGAEGVSQRAHEQFLADGAPIPLAISFNNLAVLAHSQGRYHEAIGLFARALSEAHRAGSPRYEATILLGQADLFNDLGLQHQAGDLYGQGLRQAVEAGNEHLIAYGYLQTSRLHRRCGNLDLAREWLDRALTIEHNGYRIDYDIQEQALTLPASPARAQARLLELYDGIDPDDDPNHAVEALCFLSQADLELGQEGQAAAHLGRAFDLANLHGALQVPAGESVYDGRLLDLGWRRLPGHPVVGLLARRLELAGWMASQYGGGKGPQRRGAKLELLALGETEVILDGVRVRELSPLPRQLLFFLADRMPVDRDAILEEFWPEAEPEKQRSSLYSAVHSIKAELGEESVAIEGSLYRLNREWEIGYDVARFERAAGTADAIPVTDPRRYFALKEALARYGGAFLAEYDLEWTLVRRRALEMEYLRLLDEHAEASRVAGQPKEAAASLGRALELDPLREDLLYRYLELLGELGRRNEVVRHYLAYVDRLADELGLTPSRRLRQLYADLIA